MEEYALLARRLDEAQGVAALELNISCPNVAAGGVQFGTDPKLAAKVTGQARKAFSRTLLVKLSPQISDLPGMARALVDAGADALSLINTIPAMAIDAQSRRPVLANVTGGLSGPAIKPVALKAVYEAAKAVEVPIVGVGGIMSATDAVEFMLAGASAIQIGCANFVKPAVAMEIIDGLNEYCEKSNLSSIRQLIGALEIVR